MALLEVGAVAPDIKALGDDGKPVTLSGLRGHHVLVYFYPMDDTSGCTAEACSLNNALDDLRDCGADVIGVSTQDDTSHRRFRDKNGLRFALAADTDRAIADAYGVGHKFRILTLVARQSFLVGPDGKIVEVWQHVNPLTHADEVLDAVKRHTPALKGSQRPLRRGGAPAGRRPS